MTPLCFDLFTAQQPCHTVPAALLAHVTHIQPQFAETIHTTTLQPSVLEKAPQALVINSSLTLWLCFLGVVITGMQTLYPAHATRCKSTIAWQ